MNAYEDKTNKTIHNRLHVALPIEPQFLLEAGISAHSVMLAKAEKQLKTTVEQINNRQGVCKVHSNRPTNRQN